MGLLKRLCALTCAGLVMAGCAGRDAVPVSAYSPNDAQMACPEIDSEIQRINDALRVRVNESADTSDRNIVIGAAAILLFWPAAFAMDLKDAASTEATSLEQRNATLTQMGAKGRCRTARALTVAEAEAERAAAKAAEQRMAEEAGEPGMPAPTGAQVAGPGVQPAVMQASAPSAPVNRDRLRDLMDRFLRGEISKAEYERLRAG